MVGGLVGVDPSVMDNVDTDEAIDQYSSLLNNSPKIIRSPEALQQIRQQRAQQQAQAQQAEIAQKLCQVPRTSPALMLVAARMPCKP